MNKYIDHTLLKQDSTKAQINTLCEEAMQYDFASVCVNPYWVPFCAEKLAQSDVMVCTVVGFPLGATTSKTKAFETKEAIENGADEVDMVINIGALKDRDFDYIVSDIKAVVDAANGKCVKVIIETCLLTDEEIVLACEACLSAKATFVKTSTGFSKAGATVEAVVLMKKTVKDECLIKAAGGIRDYNGLVEMIEKGANRIGTSSGIQLLNKENQKSDNIVKY